MAEKYNSDIIAYTIHKYSSYSANYTPDKILVNVPSDQLSRWFTDSTTPTQFLMLKLESPAIVELIKFGKYIKAHVSDLKKFQIYGGTDENNMSLLLTAGLKKDHLPETFRLRHRTVEGLYIPVNYIKIVPLQSWGPAYNYTVWYVELHGKKQEELINDVIDTINLRKEEDAVRLILKHLQRRRYKAAFEALSRESGIQLEGPLQARLWDALVENADYAHAERIINEAVSEGELDWYMSWQPYTPVWRLMSSCSAAVEYQLCCAEAVAPAPAAPHHDITCDDRDPAPDMMETSTEAMTGACEPGAKCGTCDPNGPGGSKPGPRGGHQLVVDPTTGTLYLFGGWSGEEDLDDLWAYDTCGVHGRWTLLCAHSGRVGGPSPRSCHKMVFDPVHKRLYTLGRYLDGAQRVPENMNSDLYVYDVSSGEWALVCADTAAAGGPRLVFDHQMCIDPDTQTIYVFGGRVLPLTMKEAMSPQYSGLYAYYIARGTWQLLLADQHDLDAPQPRVSHSMLFHPIQRRLYIFAGQRNKEHLVDLWWYDVATHRCRALCTGEARAPPGAGFTQRATLDPDTDEMFVLSGMSKEKDKRVYNTLWAFSLRRRSWTCVYRNASVTLDEPRPRYAHQLVYDPVRKIHYLFGGNPGIHNIPRLRLDDLWSLKLVRTSAKQVGRDAAAAIREACYRELATTPGREQDALRYLRKEVHEVFDHSDPQSVLRFRQLASVLFSGETGAEAGAAGCALSPGRVRALARRRARQAPANDLAYALAAVLGSEETIPGTAQPFEEPSEPTPDTWEVADESEEPLPADWPRRHARILLYDRLAKYFPPSTVPPSADITNLIEL